MSRTSRLPIHRIAPTGSRELQNEGSPEFAWAHFPSSRGRPGAGLANTFHDRFGYRIHALLRAIARTAD
jgi:hypothetical protein